MAPTVLLVIGMAGAGKTTFIQRLYSHLSENGDHSYLINLDPAVASVPFPVNIDIRDTIKYKDVMKNYGLGPNGAIMTSLNLFTTKFDQVLDLLEKRSSDLDWIIVDTPGQIEIFTWSASGAILTGALSQMFPTVIVYVADVPRCTHSPTTFMSNMLYATSILYKCQLPFVTVLNKSDISGSSSSNDRSSTSFVNFFSEPSNTSTDRNVLTLVKWCRDFETYQEALSEEDDETSANGFMNSFNRSMSLVLEEFYNCMRLVPLSSFTGKGFKRPYFENDAENEEDEDEKDKLVDDIISFDDAVAEAIEEYEKYTKPRIDKKMAEIALKKEKQSPDDLSRLMKDLKTESSLNENNPK